MSSSDVVVKSETFEETLDRKLSDQLCITISGEFRFASQARKKKQAPNVSMDGQY